MTGTARTAMLGGEWTRRHARTERAIYRSPRPSFGALQQRSDAKGLAQFTGHLIAILGSGALYAFALEHALAWPVIVLLLVTYGFTLVTMFAAMHETVHRTAFSSLWLNNAVAWIAGLASFYNSTFYRHYHGWHHRFTQIPGKDPELDDPKPTSLPAYALELSGIPWWIGKLRTYAALASGQTQAYPYLKEKTGRDAVRSVRLQLTVYGVAIAVSIARSVKTLAEANGLRATFMPKPFAGLSGNGCHVHVSLWDDRAEQNLFADKNGELGLSRAAYEFIGGLLHNAEAVCALTNPTVNSFKRIHGMPTTSGATWSPNTISYAGNNRTHMIRIPDAGRFELRLPDGSANPYLLQAMLIAAGLDGLAHHRDPGRRCDNNMYTEPLAAGDVRTLPTNLLDALRALKANAEMVMALGAPFVDAYTKLKELAWHEHHAQILPWERAATLDC